MHRALGHLSCREIGAEEQQGGLTGSLRELCNYCTGGAFANAAQFPASQFSACCTLVVATCQRPSLSAQPGSRHRESVLYPHLRAYHLYLHLYLHTVGVRGPCSAHLVCMTRPRPSRGQRGWEAWP